MADPSSIPADVTTTSFEDLLPDAATTLTTGWERDVASDDSIVRWYLETLVERLTTSARLTGTQVVDHGPAVFVDLESPYVFDNIAVCLGPWSDVEVQKIARAAVGFFGADRPFTLLSLSPWHDLRPAGFELLGHPPLMWRPAGGSGPVVPDELEILPVVGSERLADFERTLVAAYPLPEGGAIVDPRLVGETVSGWVGYVDGVPVATAGSFTAKGLTEIEWVSTLAERRGHGYGAALTWAALGNGQRTPAVLLATDDGRPVYRRLGFVPVIRLTMWLHA